MTVTDLEPILLKQKEAAALTGEIRHLQDRIVDLAATRRSLWHDLNKSDRVSQNILARQAGVTVQTVYMEVRKHREQAG